MTNSMAFIQYTGPEDNTGTKFSISEAATDGSVTLTMQDDDWHEKDAAFHSLSITLSRDNLVLLQQFISLQLSKAK